MLGLTELQAASACKVSLRTYRRYVAGHPQRFSGVVDFAIKFDLSLDWLAQGEGGYVSLHLAERAPGKIEILPAIGPGNVAGTDWDRNWDRNRRDVMKTD